MVLSAAIWKHLRSLVEDLGGAFTKLVKGASILLKRPGKGNIGTSVL